MLTTGTTPPITVGNWNHAVLGQIGIGQRHVAGAEIDRLATDLLDARARADDCS